MTRHSSKKNFVFQTSANHQISLVFFPRPLACLLFTILLSHIVKTREGKPDGCTNIIYENRNFTYRNNCNCWRFRYYIHLLLILIVSPCLHFAFLISVNFFAMTAQKHGFFYDTCMIIYLLYKDNNNNNQ